MSIKIDLAPLALRPTLSSSLPKQNYIFVGICRNLSNNTSYLIV